MHRCLRFSKMAANFKEVFFIFPGLLFYHLLIYVGTSLDIFYHHRLIDPTRARHSRVKWTPSTSTVNRQVHMMVIFRDSQGHPTVLTLSVRHGRNPRETHVSSKTTSPLRCCFSLLPQINFWTIRKVCHVEQQSFNSYCFWPFPQRYGNGPLNS